MSVCMFCSLYSMKILFIFPAVYKRTKTIWNVVYLMVDDAFESGLLLDLCMHKCF